MKSILVSGASGVVGYGVLRSLRKSAHPYRLIGTTIYTDSVAPAFSDCVEIAPRTSDAGYLAWLCEMIRRHRIDLIIPSIECDMYHWNDHRAELAAAGALVVLNNPELIDICRDKWCFYEALNAFAPALAIPSRLSGTYEEIAATYGSPFLLKPRQGYASRGIVRVNSKEVFDRHAPALGTVLMAQPIIGSADQEYSTSAFFDAQSRLCCHMTLRRTLAGEGYTQTATVSDHPDIRATIETLAARFKPVGPTNFQFRVSGSQLKVLEINPRISSATSIRMAFGYNESEMSAAFYLDGAIPSQPAVRRGQAVRYVEEYVVYDSDNS